MFSPKPGAVGRSGPAPTWMQGAQVPGHSKMYGAVRTEVHIYVWDAGQFPDVQFVGPYSGVTLDGTSCTRYRSLLPLTPHLSELAWLRVALQRFRRVDVVEQTDPLAPDKPPSDSILGVPRSSSGTGILLVARSYRSKLARRQSMVPTYVTFVILNRCDTPST